MVSIEKLYALMGDATPLSADCGEVCAAACCHGDTNTGMLLFPGETPPFGRVVGGERRLFVCDGQCQRAARPLACRLFPLFPYLTAEGRVRAVYDPRAFLEEQSREIDEINRFLSLDGVRAPICRR